LEKTCDKNWGAKRRRAGGGGEQLAQKDAKKRGLGKRGVGVESKVTRNTKQTAALTGQEIWLGVYAGSQ